MDQMKGCFQKMYILPFPGDISVFRVLLDCPVNTGTRLPLWLRALWEDGLHKSDFTYSIMLIIVV